MKKTICFLIHYLLAANIFCQVNLLDTNFGNGNGYVGIDLKRLDAGARIKSLANGDIIVAGITADSSVELVVTKYKNDGSLDNTFGKGGILYTGIVPNDEFGDVYWATENWVAFQSDGGFAMYTRPNGDWVDSVNLFRFKNDGTRDLSFGKNGSTVYVIKNYALEPGSISVQPDQKVVISGSVLDTIKNTGAKLFLARLKVDGSPDSTFGRNGLVIWQAGYNFGGNSILPLPNGNLLVGGSGNDVATRKNFIRGFVCFKDSGAVDYTFGKSGTAFVPILLRNGNPDLYYFDSVNSKIYLAASMGDAIAPQTRVYSFTTQGTVDATFGALGNIFFGNPIDSLKVNSMIVGADSKIIVSGIKGKSASFFSRINHNGLLDISFGFKGVYQLPIQKLAPIVSIDRQLNGYLLFTGFVANTNYDILVGRLLYP